MRKMVSVVLLAVLLLLLAGCSKVSINGVSGSVVYDINGICFEDTLTQEELDAVVNVLDGKKQKSILSGVPSCGFSADVAIIVDGRRFALACDKCGVLQNCSTGGFIYVSDEERSVLEAIFTSRGGKFPCI